MGLDLTGIGSVADFATTLVNKLWPTADPNEKLKAQVELQHVLEQRETLLLDTQKQVMVAELAQQDTYTKRARPTIVYCGLVFIFLVHVALPLFAFFSGKPVPALTLPEEFWWAWTGVSGLWILGRSFEKQGSTGKLIQAITGSK